jgi:hypothetical protein
MRVIGLPNMLIVRTNLPNLAAAGNARSAFLFAAARQWPGVPEPHC